MKYLIGGAIVILSFLGYADPEAKDLLYFILVQMPMVIVGIL